MRKTQKILLSTATSISLLAVGLLTGCSADESDSAQASNVEKLNVVTTFTVLADMARNVAGDVANVESLTKPGAEIHDYEPTPSDIKKASKADLILDNGLGLERWFERFTQDVDTPHATLSDGVKPINIAADAYAGKPNPHAWMSPTAAQKYVDNIEKALSTQDPKNSTTYAKNATAYKEKIAGVDKQLKDGLAQLPEKSRTLVTCEGAFSYLTRDAGMKEGYIWPVNAEQEATPQQMRDVISFVKDNKVPSVFCESTVSDGGKKQIMAETGARDGGTLYVDSLSDEGGPVPTYLDLLAYDAKTIVEGLK